MELTPELMYWITRLDGIILGAVLSVVISGIALILLIVPLVISIIDDGDKKHVQLFKKFIWMTSGIFVLSLLVCIFTPSTKDMFVIYGVPALAKQGEKAWNTFGDDAEAAIKAWLKKQATDEKE